MLINYVFLRKLALFVFLHRYIVGAKFIKAFKVLRVARFHLVSYHHLKIAECIADLDLKHDVLAWICHKGSDQCQALAMLFALIHRLTRRISVSIHHSLDQLFLVVIAITVATSI